MKSLRLVRFIVRIIENNNVPFLNNRIKYNKHKYVKNGQISAKETFNEMSQLIYKNLIFLI